MEHAEHAHYSAEQPLTPTQGKLRRHTHWPRSCRQVSMAQCSAESWLSPGCARPCQAGTPWQVQDVANIQQNTLPSCLAANGSGRPLSLPTVRHTMPTVRNTCHPDSAKLPQTRTTVLCGLAAQFSRAQSPADSQLSPGCAKPCQAGTAWQVQAAGGVVSRPLCHAGKWLHANQAHPEASSIPHTHFPLRLAEQLLIYLPEQAVRSRP